MNPIVAHFVNQKLNTIGPNELISLAAQYQLPISQSEAVQIVNILRRQTIDIKNLNQRKQIIATIAKEVSPEKANYIQYLIQTYIDR
jgi:replication initiation and membrane attachment protein DnaB